jgi:hypothetical protein
LSLVAEVVALLLMQLVLVVAVAAEDTVHLFKVSLLVVADRQKVL